MAALKCAEQGLLKLTLLNYFNGKAHGGFQVLRHQLHSWYATFNMHFGYISLIAKRDRYPTWGIICLSLILSLLLGVPFSRFTHRYHCNGRFNEIDTYLNTD